MSEKAVTVPVSWMQDKEKQNHPCVQRSNLIPCLDKSTNKNRWPVEIFQAIFKITPLFVICSRKQKTYKNLQNLEKLIFYLSWT